MSRRKIDAHVHIVPATVLGASNENIQYFRNGKAVLKKYHDAVFQNVPDIIGDSSFTTETLRTVLTNAGVEKGVIMVSVWPMLSTDVIAAVQQNSDFFRGAMGIDPTKENLLQSVQFAHQLGLSIIKLVMADSIGFTAQYPGILLNDPKLIPVWRYAEENRMTVAIDAGPIGNKGYTIDVYRMLLESFPKLHFVFCHLGLPFPGMHQDTEKYTLWKKMCKLAEHQNAWFECSALSTFYLQEAYPFPSAQKIVREFMDRYGKDKVIWGTDIPGTLSDATYRQLIDTYERSTLFTEEEKDAMFYTNAAKAYYFEEK